MWKLFSVWDVHSKFTQPNDFELPSESEQTWGAVIY